ncbi:MAG: aminopeptidase, partial [Pseudomonadales bacterium]
MSKRLPVALTHIEELRVGRNGKGRVLESEIVGIHEAENSMRVIGRLSGFRRLAGLTVAVLVLGGCETVSFYAQAVAGHMSLVTNKRPVQEVLADPTIDPQVRRQLAYTLSVRDYASDVLRLPVDPAYTDYVDTGRAYVVWNVFAAPEFSLELKTFCYPVAGCVGYRGYFNEDRAKKFARSLAEDGLDVFVGGVAAYSTLGWFADPVLNTFLNRSDVELAALLFHEIAHKAVYVPGDTRFNESFATAVERAALQGFLQLQDEPGQYESYLARRRRDEAIVMLFSETRTALERIYSQPMSDDAKRLAKQSEFAHLNSRYRELHSD